MANALLTTLCESCICILELYMFVVVLCFFSYVDRFFFKIWALCVIKKVINNDSELEHAYIRFMLKFLCIKGNAKMSKVRIGVCYRPNSLLDYMA
jgi:hypothetical protein